MIWICIAIAGVTLFLLERFWMPAALNALKFRGKCDKIMAQPGEVVTWHSTVENHSRLSIPFVRLNISCPEGTQLEAPERWIQSHYRKGVYQWYIEEKMALKPHQSVTRTVSFSLPNRGVYEIGDYLRAVGDLLGIREGTKMGDCLKLVIIPERSRNFKTIQAFGGFLGEVSVKRFILEDPILTVGFRDYTGREPMKAVSWTRTAVAGKLQVKQFDYTAEQNVTVILNVDGAAGECLEECFRLTRSVCEELENRKIPYGFRTNGNLSTPTGKLFYLANGLGQKHLQTILYALGRADNTCFRSCSSLVRDTLRHRKMNEAYVVITPRGSEGLGMLESLSGNSLCVLYGEEVQP